MAATENGGGSPKGAAAVARSERDPKPKSYTWRGVKLTLPATLPGTLLWDFRGMEEDPVGFLEAFIGHEQSLAVREKVLQEEISLEDMVDEFRKIIEGILRKYGMNLGESRASESSSASAGNS